MLYLQKSDLAHIQYVTLTGFPSCPSFPGSPGIPWDGKPQIASYKILLYF